MEESASKKPKMEFQHEADFTILHLNYDCLYYVLSYLNVQELIVAEEVCVMFKAIAKDIYKARRVLDFKFLIDTIEWSSSPVYYEDPRMQQAKVEKIFQRVGPYVDTLRLDRDIEQFLTHSKVLEFVWLYCSKLQSVSFNSIEFNNNTIWINLSTVFNNVDKVFLYYCDSMTDEKLQMIFNLRQIKKLTLYSEIARFKGDFLTHLQDIQKITLVNCLHLESNKFLHFIEANTQLTHLNIQKSTRINGTCLRAIARNLINLEELGISCDHEEAQQESYLPLMDLPKLKALLVCQCYSIPNMDGVDIGVLIERIAAYNRLEQLRIIFGPTTVLSNKLAQAMTHFTKLKILGFRNAPNGICSALGDLKCEQTLEKLSVNKSNLSSTDLANIINKCQNLRFIDASYCHGLQEKFIPLIEGVLRTRSHKLIIDLQCSFVWLRKETYDKDKLELIV